ncbi:MAG: DNA repair protein RadC [Rhodothermales bacterium]
MIHSLHPTDADPNVSYQPIHQWDEGDRPRERLLKHGPEILSDAELIALIFGTGARLKRGSISAVQLGRVTLKAFGSLRALSRKDMRATMQVTGIGKAKASQLIAAFEIGRRIESQPEEKRIQVKSPEDVAAVYGPLMRDLKREIFKVVLLNTANVIQGDYTISEGGLAASIVEPRAVFQKAILDNAAAIICLHNHPSGNLEPSREDIRVTRQLVEAGKIMGIPLHDHLIIAGRGFTSLAERGLM